jgi:hypothetical protein
MITEIVIDHYLNPVTTRHDLGKIKKCPQLSQELKCKCELEIPKAHGVTVDGILIAKSNNYLFVAS